MSKATNTFRVFISSTFSDLKEERNALQERVFPELRNLAAQHGCRFQAIDLRWGVSQEASIDQKTMNICLGEIERCQKVTPRPNFLVLMGDRYGWMPPPPQIPADEFNRIRDALTPEKRKLLLWEESDQDSEDNIQMVRWDPEKEAYIGDKGWYHLDHNAVPPAYVLQPWEGFSYEEWGEIEKDIQSTLAEQADALGFSDKAKFKYWASATHQEIESGALQVDDADEHVHCFFRAINEFPSQFSTQEFLEDLDERLDEDYPEGLPELFEEYKQEIKQINAILNAREINDKIKKMWKESLKDSLEREFIEKMQGWLADFSGKDFLNLNDDDWAVDQTAHEHQKDLKKALETHVPGNVTKYTATWTGRGITTGHIDQFCKDVYQALSELILNEIETPHQSTEIEGKTVSIRIDKTLDEEGVAHHSFAEERLAHFVGRTEILGKITNFLVNNEARALAIFGKGGTGKSALAAKAIQQAQVTHKGSEIIYRFIGATPGSSDGRALLTSLCQEISRRYGVSDSDIPMDYQDLVPELVKRMALATGEHPLILFLDSLDQLSEQHGARNLTWLPDTLPTNVQIIATTRQEEDTYDRLESKQVRLEELDGLSDKEGDQLLTDWLEAAKRDLQALQRKEVLARFEQSDGSPLYLKLAFEEARLWPSWDSHNPENLEPGIEGIIEGNLINRMEDEASHGKMLVSNVLGYLAASRYGLAEDEIIDLLSRDLEMYEWFFKKSKYHLPTDLVRWAVQYRRDETLETAFTGPTPDKDEERGALAWLRDIRNPPEKVSNFLRKALPKPKGPKLPVVLWSRLFLDLEPYLSEQISEGSTLLTFYHRELDEVSKKVFLENGNGQKFHEKLSNYFRFMSDPGEKGEWKGNSPRGLSELPYHLTEAEEWDEVFKTLTDFRFLEEKAAKVGVLDSKDEKGNQVMTFTGVFHLQEDYERVLVSGGGTASSSGEHPLIITAVDRGEGLTVYCPVCNKISSIEEEQLDSVITCPQPDCSRRLKINPFVTKVA